MEILAEVILVGIALVILWRTYRMERLAARGKSVEDKLEKLEQYLGRLEILKKKASRKMPNWGR